MILGFLGKGGSGKSSVSWLATQVLQERKQHVLAVDADHNMDLVHIFNQEVDAHFPTLHRAHNSFLKTVGHQEDKAWHNIVLDGRTTPRFTLNPKDSFTESVTTTLNPLLDFMVVGLGAEDVLFSSRCAHGHSAPLKYYLPFLELGSDQWCVIDGVAGVDMMNFGLFLGADSLVVVVEPHPNSIRVYREISRIASESNLPVSVIINKSRESEIRDNLVEEVGDKLIAELPIDEGVLTYDYARVSEETKEQMSRALGVLSQKVAPNEGLSRLQDFEQKRQSVKG